jgi:hypothetical protein
MKRPLSKSAALAGTRQNAHERILNVGGLNDGGSR